jgi:hypothetical protein
MTDDAETVARLRRLLERAEIILGNMAMENSNKFFGRRWPIHHEPLRADAKSLLPEIAAALRALAAMEPT